MEVIQPQPEGGRYSPPVSPRTKSTEPGPSLAIQGDDFFLDNINRNFDNTNRILPYRQPSPQSDHGESLNHSPRHRPPPLQLATDYEQAGRNSRLPDQTPRSQMASPCHSKPLSAVSLDVRPLEELLNERAYLLQNLHKQDERAAGLFQRYATLESQLAEAQTAKEARKIRKDAKLLKHKITESTQQEQLIFLRLGEIYIEIQNRDRWMKFRHQQPAALPMQVYFPPLHYGTRDAAPIPPPPPTPVAAGFNHHFPQPLAGLSSRFSSIAHAIGANPNYPSYPLSPYLVPQPSPAFSSYSSASPLTPFSPEFVPGVSFSKDIWGHPGCSPRPSHRQNHYPIEADNDEESQQLATRVAEIPTQGYDEHDQNHWQQDEEEEIHHNIVPWHELKHNIEGTTITPNNTRAEDDESEDTMYEYSAEDQTSSDLTGEGSSNTTDDEETRVFRNYLRAVSINEDEMTPSALSPRGYFNWLDEAGGREKRMSLP